LVTRRVPWIVWMSIACVLLATSCATHIRVNAFRVVPAAPTYLLRSPDASETPFPDVLRVYNGFEPGRGWMDLRPDMELRIENAYYEPGMPKRGLKGFLGTEVARYTVHRQGHLQLVSVQPMKNRPIGEKPVQQLISGSQQRYRYHRFYYAIVFKRTGDVRGSVLLGANKKDDLDGYAAQLLADPDSVCNGKSPHCTIFPEGCSVSIEMQVFVNGTPQNVIWGSLLASIAPHPRSLELLRLYNGSLTPVHLDAHDPNALRLPLLPGDRLNWN